ncbi:UDP-2,3-diacylglucosamine diphosphatase [Marinigracilibium pacificum]|uniref:UDP-2,3-diacylglucosamine diphosphatase n=1 Tax=Marinigracilibium pacificum TaxID=2729599 RepID=A0A848J4S9_9BACT|nr:UDP-2,3-diacylglucosamine diphosphatase [Marinigracilibium pacificum]NMM49464.1 UDP-2,3-diacylglucosamine diphosphatase [Marinigracilibium pacificum]
MPEINIDLQTGKKLYFASDFHLGVDAFDTSQEREEKIIAWLKSISDDAHVVFLVGDIFDFWFEYRKVVPKGFIGFLNQVREVVKKGIPVYFFKGNHDMWMFDYIPEITGASIISDELILKVNGKRLFVHHGDGLGPGDKSYKLLKKVFRSKLCQWLFALLHPAIGMGIAHFWSSQSKKKNNGLEQSFEDKFKENIWLYCKESEKTDHFDMYICGHRHLVLDLEVEPDSRYYNIGEWMTGSPYGVFDGENFKLCTFKG